MALQVVYTVTQSLEVAHVKYLRTNMEMESDNFNIIYRLSLINNLIHVLHGYAELVLSKTGSNVGMGVSSDVRIDTERYTGLLAVLLCKFVNHLKLGYRLYIEACDIVLKSEFYLPIALAYSSIYYAVGRKASLKCRLYFATTYTICTKSVLAYDAQDFLVGISLDSIMNMIVGMLATLFLYGLKCLTQKLCVVIVERRACILKFIYGEHFLMFFYFYFLVNSTSERF